MHDPFDLRRFVAAQAPVMPQLLRELAAGQGRAIQHGTLHGEAALRGAAPAEAARPGAAGLVATG